MTCGSVRPEKFPVKLDLTKDLNLNLTKAKKKEHHFHFPINLPLKKLTSTYQPTMFFHQILTQIRIKKNFFNLEIICHRKEKIYYENKGKRVHKDDRAPHVCVHYKYIYT